MIHYQATFTYYYHPTGSSQTSETMNVEFYAVNNNIAMCIAASRFLSMFNSTDYFITRIDLSIIQSGT